MAYVPVHIILLFNFLNILLQKRIVFGHKRNWYVAMLWGMDALVYM